MRIFEVVNGDESYFFGWEEDAKRFAKESEKVMKTGDVISHFTMLHNYLKYSDKHAVEASPTKEKKYDAETDGVPFIDKHFVERPDEFAALLNKVAHAPKGVATGASRQTHISASEDSTTHGH